jgi:hypothetical protein
MEKHESTALTVVLFLVLFAGLVVCVFWWGLLGWLFLSGIRLLLRLL